MGSLSNRLARLITATLTVWCLGCSSFDVLLDHLLGRDGGTPPISCMSEAGAGAVDGPGMMASRAEQGVRDAIGCGCAHCVALRTAASAPLRVPATPPQDFAPLIAYPLSVEPVPLVPPPLA